VDLNEVKYQQAYQNMQMAGLTMAAAAREAFPMGAAVEWKINGHAQRGEVLSHGWKWERYGVEITVRNTRTNKTHRVFSRFLKLVEG
jgi:hypothetical protein